MEDRHVPVINSEQEGGYIPKMSCSFFAFQLPLPVGVDKQLTLTYWGSLCLKNEQEGGFKG